MWVHVYGRLDYWLKDSASQIAKSKPTVIIFNIKKIINFNELTHHFCDVIFAHLSRTAQVPEETVEETDEKKNCNADIELKMQTQQRNGQQDEVRNENNGSDAYNGHDGFNGYNTKYRNDGSNGKEGNDKIMQGTILQLIQRHGHQNEIGCPAYQIYEAIPNIRHWIVESAIENLIDEGMIYTTVDNQHYKAIDSD